MPLRTSTTAFVWVWLPGASAPVVAGRLDDEGGYTTFTYGRRYLDRADAIAVYHPELPLQRGQQVPELRALHGCIADAGPDAWGRRVIGRLRGADPRRPDLDLTDIGFLLESGSDRIGGLDFQRSADEYQPRGEGSASLEDLMKAAEIVDESLPLDPALDRALLHGTAVGGAQPKAVLIDGDRHLIAKFGSIADQIPVVKAEYVAMTLARRAGVDAAPVEITRVLGKDVLLVERFDRPGGDLRRIMVSVRTILHLGEMGMGASYAELADLVRARFTQPAETLRELFARITFNILVGNTDDHARNHAAFWDGTDLTLTPAFDVVPQLRRGEAAAQAMAIGPDGFRESQLAGCVSRAATYQLTVAEAREIIDAQIAVISSDWDGVCDEAGLTEVDRADLWSRQVLNPFALRGY